MARNGVSLVLLAATVLFGCGSGGGGGTTAGSNGGSSGGSNGSSGSDAAVTDVGAPIAGFQPSHANIDANGGTLTSPDGQLTLTIPAGALSSTTQISITAIQNTAPGGVGFAYRFGPDGQTFAQPVTLTFHPTYGQLDGATPTLDNLVLAYQTSDHTWLEVPGLTGDGTNKTATATTTHFTDYAFLLSLELVAANSALLGGQSTNVSVSSVPAVPVGDGLYAGSPVDLALTGNPTWMLNGTPGAGGPDGTLSPLTNTAAYTAPTQQPAHDPEVISVAFTASDGSRVTLVNSIYVLAHKYDLAVTISETGDCASPNVAYSFSSAETSDIEIDLDNAINVTSGAPGPQGVPTVGDTGCCVDSPGVTCTATWDGAIEEFAMQLTSATGFWDEQNHRLNVVARGLNQLFPTLHVSITTPGGTSESTVFGDPADAWNAPGYPFLLDGAANPDDVSINTSTASYTGSIASTLTPTQF